MHWGASTLVSSVVKQSVMKASAVAARWLRRAISCKVRSAEAVVAQLGTEGDGLSLLQRDLLKVGAVTRVVRALTGSADHRGS